ncbi:MAG: hypothetical protein EA418_05210 [Wenzhouxiangellaceae bacterium]|nr:MAG: hypothetical protein EA418_05210 [Wenzhouxiangellaceae bacterium]
MHPGIILYPLTAVWLLLLVASSALASEYRIKFERYQQMASWFSYPDELPFVTFFAKDGRCVLQQELDLDWTATRLASPETLVPDPECRIFRSDGPGTQGLTSQSRWHIHLWTLDIDSCPVCEHAETQLRSLLEENPDQFSLTISRVFFPE